MGTAGFFLFSIPGAPGCPDLIPQRQLMRVRRICVVALLPTRKWCSTSRSIVLPRRLRRLVEQLHDFRHHALRVRLLEVRDRPGSKSVLVTLDDIAAGPNDDVDA